MQERGESDPAIEEFCRFYTDRDFFTGFPMLVISDDSDFTSATLNNFLWVTFTRSNPATDIYGINAELHERHWGCSGALVIDSRIKPFHAPVLEDDPEVERRIDELGKRGGPLEGLV